MKGDYNNGEYKDVDIEFKFESLKIIWISCLLDHTCQVLKVRLRNIAKKNFSNLAAASKFLQPSEGLGACSPSPPQKKN